MTFFKQILILALAVVIIGCGFVACSSLWDECSRDHSFVYCAYTLGK